MNDKDLLQMSRGYGNLASSVKSEGMRHTGYRGVEEEDTEVKITDLKRTIRIGWGVAGSMGATISLTTQAEGKTERTSAARAVKAKIPRSVKVPLDPEPSASTSPATSAQNELIFQTNHLY